MRVHKVYRSVVVGVRSPVYVIQKCIVFHALAWLIYGSLLLVLKINLKTSAPFDYCVLVGVLRQKQLRL